MRSMRWMFVAVAVLCLQAVSFGQTQAELRGFVGQRVVVTLSNGDVFRGSLLDLADGNLVMTHPVIGEVRIPRVGVESVVLRSSFEREQEAADARAAEAEAALAAQESEAAAEAPAEDPAPEPEPEVKWSGSFELGFNGSQGSTETENLRVGAFASRETDGSVLNLGLVYTWKREDSENTENRLVASAFHEWLFEDSKWTVFAETDYTYDEFEEWDGRWRGALGVGYRFIENEDTTLTGRIGAGGFYEFGGDDEGFVPEAQFGLDFEHDVTDNQKLTADFTYFLDLEDANEFRTVSNAGYQIAMADDLSLSLKFGVQHRYDSKAEEDESDWDYFALVVYSF